MGISDETPSFSVRPLEEADIPAAAEMALEVRGQPSNLHTENLLDSQCVEVLCTSLFATVQALSSQRHFRMKSLHAMLGLFSA